MLQSHHSPHLSLTVIFISLTTLSTFHILALRATNVTIYSPGVIYLYVYEEAVISNDLMGVPSSGDTAEGSSCLLIAHISAGSPVLSAEG